MNKKYRKPSVHTIVYWLIQDKKIEPDLLFDLLKFFWPTFIKKDGYVFSKEAFSEKEYKRLVNENSNPEYWINLLTVDDFFLQTPKGEEKSGILAKALASIWDTKLKKEFPDMSFTVEYLHDEETGDCGLTFYQAKISRVQKLKSEVKRICTPNIKENILEQSSKGPRPGMPKLRKPRADEIPKLG